MSEEQEEHLQSIKDDFISLVDSKYRKGAVEHDSDLQDSSVHTLVAYAIEEAIDQVVYLLTLQAKLKEVENGSLHSS